MPPGHWCKDNMTLPPFIMTPSFRSGALTPWGGRKLAKLYNKQIPDDHTGESLEISVIPEFESKSHGVTLSELIIKYGAALTGSQVNAPFPLLLKLIDARETLSVQVHPGDDYAWLRHRKLGKSEAWTILAAAPDASLVLGFREGVTPDLVRDHITRGNQIKALLRQVPVHPGETYYMPSGTVHAIGGGIVLYEIQQSSDLTYRLYDWDRKDANGKSRDLHIRESLDVIDISSRPIAAVPFPLPAEGKGNYELLLDNANFKLFRLRSCREMRVLPDPGYFSVLTALEHGALTWSGGQLDMQKGQTALLPADGFELRFSGALALLAKP